MYIKMIPENTNEGYISSIHNCTSIDWATRTVERNTPSGVIPANALYIAAHSRHAYLKMHDSFHNLLGGMVVSMSIRLK